MVKNPLKSPETPLGLGVLWVLLFIAHTVVGLEHVARCCSHERKKSGWCWVSTCCPGWGTLRLGFSEDVMVLTASKGWQRRILVVDRQTGYLRFAAGKPCFGGSRSPIDVRHLDQNI